MVVGVAGNCRATGIDDLHALARFALNTACGSMSTPAAAAACSSPITPVAGSPEPNVPTQCPSTRTRAYLSPIHPATCWSRPPDLSRFARYPEQPPIPTVWISGGSPRSTDPGASTRCGCGRPSSTSAGPASRRWSRLVRKRSRTCLISSSRRATSRRSEHPIFIGVLSSTAHPVSRPLSRRLGERAELRDQLRGIVSGYTRRLCQGLYEDGEIVFDLFALQDLGDVLGLGVDGKLDVMGMCVGHPTIDQTVRDGIRRRLVATAENLVQPMMSDLNALERGETVARAAATTRGPAGW